MTSFVVGEKFGVENDVADATAAPIDDDACRRRFAVRSVDIDGAVLVIGQADAALSVNLRVCFQAKLKSK